MPSKIPSRPVLWFCVPGGGANRTYFDLVGRAGAGGYSMARFAADHGVVVLTVDPPGVGESDVPDDGYELTPTRVADVLQLALADVIGRLAHGEIEDAPELTFRAKIGIGHSAGGLLISCQQARHHGFDALALLGFSDSGLPGVLTEEELAYADRPEELLEALPDLVKERFGGPYPELGGADMRMGVPEPLKGAVARTESRLLAMVGMMALVPGSMKPELDRIDVPTLVAVGQHDIAGDVGALPGQLPACRDLTLIILAATGHNHNWADARMTLWDRLIRWSDSMEIGP